MQQRWAMWLAITIAMVTSCAFVALGVYIYADGVFEQRTVIAMSLRTTIWTAIAVFAWRIRLQTRPDRPEAILE
ncbi:MAG: hypothetical protein HN929_11760 [Chloroflexi bacterium]|nr:hypothetical protein [Chloroflexota bacterium]